MNSRAILLLGAWAPLVVLGFGCQTHDSNTVQSAFASGEGPRIDEATLNGLGFEELWFIRPQSGENPVNKAYLLDEGLFISTLPKSGHPGRLMMVKRDDGTTRWYFDLQKSWPIELQLSLSFSWHTSIAIQIIFRRISVISIIPD